MSFMLDLMPMLAILLLCIGDEEKSDWMKITAGILAIISILYLLITFTLP